MIVKDESAFIEDCLRSLDPVVDEVIVVDTGSTDGTQDLVRKFKKAKLIEIVWEEDFAKARNVSLDHASGEWILIIDADERLHPDDVDRLKKLVKWGTAQAYYIDIVNFPDDPDNTVVSKRLGLFRRRPDIRFESRIHEQVDWSVARARLRVEYSDVRLLHYGYNPEVRLAKNKSERNRKLIQLCLMERPDNPFMNFNMAQEHFVLGEYRECIDYYRKAITHWEDQLEKRHTLPPYVSVAVYRMITALAALGNYSDAFEALHRYQIVFPDYTELRFVEARLHASLGDYERALGMYLQCIAFGDSPNVYQNICPGLGTYRAWYEVARIYEMLGQPRHAFEALNESLRIKNDYRPSILALARLGLKHDPPEDVYRYLKRVADIDGVLRDGSLWEIFFDERAFEIAEAVLNDADLLSLTEEQKMQLLKQRGMTMIALNRWADAETAFSACHPKELLPVDALLAKLFTGEIETADEWLMKGRLDVPLFGIKVLSDLLSLVRNPAAWTPSASENEIEFLWGLIPRVVFYGQSLILDKMLQLLRNYGLRTGEISLRLGKILWDLELKDLAAEEFIKAAQAGKFDKESLDALAKVSREKGLIEEEATFLREAYLLTDGDPMISARLARALRDLGREAEALQILERAAEKHPYASILARTRTLIEMGVGNAAAE